MVSSSEGSHVLWTVGWMVGVAAGMFLLFAWLRPFGWFGSALVTFLGALAIYPLARSGCGCRSRRGRSCGLQSRSALAT